MPKFDLRAQAIGYDGEPIKEKKQEKIKDGAGNIIGLEMVETDHVQTIKDLVFIALGSQLESDKDMTAEQRMKLYRVTQKIMQERKVNLKSDEIALIKERAGGGGLSTLGYGLICDFFDPPEEDDDEDDVPSDTPSDGPVVQPPADPATAAQAPAQ